MIKVIISLLSSLRYFFVYFLETSSRSIFTLHIVTMGLIMQILCRIAGFLNFGKLEKQQQINRFAHYLTSLTTDSNAFSPTTYRFPTRFTFFPVWQVVAWSGRGMP